MEDLIKSLRIFEKYCDDYPSAVIMTSLCSMVLARMICHLKTSLNYTNSGGILMKILDSIHLDMGVIKAKEILKDVTETY